MTQPVATLKYYFTFAKIHRTKHLYMNQIKEPLPTISIDALCKPPL